MEIDEVSDEYMPILEEISEEEVEDIIAQDRYMPNNDEIAAGVNDILDRRSYVFGDEEIVDEIADDIGIADYSPADDIVARTINAVDYNEEIAEEIVANIGDYTRDHDKIAEQMGQDVYELADEIANIVDLD
ncbi:hypothetical protein Halha_1674 [Halobacteroides halobius DSM 5150]|uniref:Uncharacterized protein n=1 Tax=Halobacteroides halobius (strain ATCC 35273 / DSM 5150 / MD-1) TaxID=748449 RepID=L0K9B8_HALHC|nr:hypothetical protein [Halobacteroides halobius]AGB41611.1 hypothetical protein Halha_1674 [Halobacteroides halobius DSM 5150]